MIYIIFIIYILYFILILVYGLNYSKIIVQTAVNIIYIKKVFLHPEITPMYETQFNKYGNLNYLQYI